MGNSLTRDLKISEERRSSRCGPAGASTPDPTSEQRQRCFRDILDLVLQLSDEELKAMGMEKEKVSRLEFASDCSEIATTSMAAVVQHLLEPLNKRFGMKAILEANDKLKKMESKKSSKLSDASAQSSPAKPSDFICELSQRIVSEMKGAMLEAIRSAASESRRNGSVRASSDSSLDDISMACSKEICERILALYLSEEGVRPERETSSRTSRRSHKNVHRKRKGLEEVHSRRSSSWSTINSLIPEIVSTMPTDGALPAPQGERPLSDPFIGKASKVVSEVLQKSEQKLAALVLPQTSVPTFGEKEMNFLMNMVRSSIAKNDILGDRLSSHGPTGSKSKKGSRSSRASSFRSSVDLDQLACDIINSVINGAVVDVELTDEENRVEALVSSQVSGSDTHSAPYSKSSLGFSSKLQSPSALEDRKSVQPDKDAETKPLPSAQNSPYVSRHLFTVVRDRLKAFITSLTTRAADDEKTDAPGSHGDSVVSIHISDDGLVHELTEPKVLSPEEMIRQQSHAITDTIANLLLRKVAKTRNVVQSVSDSAVYRRNSSVQYTQFPYELVYAFVEQSTKTLVQNVLNAEFGGDAKESSFMNKSTSCPSTSARLDQDHSFMWSRQTLYSKCSQPVSAEHQNLKDQQNQPGPCSPLQESDGGSSPPVAKNQERQRRLGFRFIVKRKPPLIRYPSKYRRTRRTLRTRRTRRTQRRPRVPVQPIVHPSVSTPKKVHYASDRHPRTSPKLFQNTRKRLGRFFSNIVKTFTCCFIPDTTP